MRMKNRLIQTGLVLAIGILFPYVVTLLLGNKASAEKTQEVDSGYVVCVSKNLNMDAEEYLVGMLAAQISPTYEAETLKAQAILARTYLYQAMNGNTVIGADALGRKYLSEEEMKAAWGDEHYKAYYQKLFDAVQETQRMTVTYEGAYIDPLFHECSAGMTRADLSGSCPYLARVDSSTDTEAPGYTQMINVSINEFLAKINQNDELKQVTVSADTVAAMQVAKDGSGYVTQVVLDGQTFRGDEIQKIFALQSTAFSFETYDDQVRILCRGKGHGYGLSQWGANQLAKQGKSYQEILRYYFSNIVISAE